MNIFLVAVNLNKKKQLSGLRVFDMDSRSAMDASLDSVKRVLSTNTEAVNGVYIDNGKIKIANQKCYTALVDNVVISHRGYIVIAIWDKAAIICDYLCNLSSTSIEGLCKDIQAGIVGNAKISSSGKIVPTHGKFVDFAEAATKLNMSVKKEAEIASKAVAEYRETQRKKEEAKKKELADEIKKTGNIDLRTYKFIHGKISDLESIKEKGDEGASADQKLVKLMNRLKRSRPYLYSVLYCLERKFTDELERAGATVDTIYLNPKYVRETPIEELYFTLVHELYHVISGHHYRGKGKDPDSWNTACDLYINSVIVHDFGMDKTGISVTELELNGNKLGYGIIRPADILYSPFVNLEKDTPELLYREIEAEKKSAGGQDSDGQGSGGPGSDGQGSSGEGSKGPSNNDEDNGEGRGKEGEGKRVTFRGHDAGVMRKDIVEDPNSRGLSEKQRENRVRSILNRAETINQKIGGKEAGYGSSLLEREVKDMLYPPITWTRLLRKYLNRETEFYTTYANPDRRFISRGMTLPGMKMDDLGGLKGIKIAVDTSGSMNDKQLAFALGSISRLLKEFKAKGELLYWDGDVSATYEIKSDNVGQLIKCRPVGGGGTDPACVYKYFENNKDYKNGVKEPPSLIVFITDGFFDLSGLEAYKKKYKDTIWVITGSNNYRAFKAPFGEKALLELIERRK